MTEEIRMNKLEASEYIGVSDRTLNRWHGLGIGPKRFKVGRKIFYTKSNIDQWIQENSK